MGLLDKLRGKPAAAAPDVPTAHPLAFVGPAPYQKALDSDWGVVFEDDGESAYFYATDAKQQRVFDALYLYDRSSPDALQPGEQIFVVWNPARLRVGLFYRHQFQAVFDLAAQHGACRTGLPSAPSAQGWSVEGRGWDEALTQGIEP